MRENMTRLEVILYKEVKGKKIVFFPGLPNCSPLIPKLSVDSRKPCNIAFCSLSTE